MVEYCHVGFHNLIIQREQIRERVHRADSDYIHAEDSSWLHRSPEQTEGGNTDRTPKERVGKERSVVSETNIEARCRG